MQDNIACAIFETHDGITHEISNRAAARVMSQLFETDITKHERWGWFVEKWREAQPTENQTLKDIITVLRRVKQVFDEALPHFNWGASALPAEAIQLLNEVPSELKAMLGRIELAQPIIEKLTRENSPSRLTRRIEHELSAGTNEEIAAWLAEKPQYIQDLYKEFPLSSLFNIGGELHHLIGYTERKNKDGSNEHGLLLLTPYDPMMDYEMAKATARTMHPSHFRARDHIKMFVWADDCDELRLHKGDLPEGKWTRDDERTRDILSLTGQGACVPLEAIKSWTDEQCETAENWAGATHLNASDNDDVVVPPIPEWVSVHDTPENREKFEKEMEDLMRNGRGGGVADTRSDAQQTADPAGSDAGFESQPPLPVILCDMEIRAIQYVRNTGGCATVAQFDDDHEPIGPKLREKIMPTFVVENISGHLFLTEAGKTLLEQE